MCLNQLGSTINKNKKLPGLTLIEVLMYLFIFGVIFGSVIFFFFDINDITRESQENVNLDRYNTFVSLHLKESIKYADSINGATSVFDNDNGRLVLNTSSGQITYELDQAALEVTRTTTTNLTPPGIEVDSFNLVRILDDEDMLRGLKLNFTLSTDNVDNLTKSYEHTYFLEK